MSHISIGVIGAGWVVRSRHLPALRNAKGAQVRMIWSRDPSKAGEVAREFGIPKVADRWQDVAESRDLDAVIIAAPPILHCPATSAALRAGKHVLCQGRMARNAGEAREMVNAARAAKLVTALYPPRPGLRGDRVMRRLLQKEGFVGEVREVRVTGMTLAEPQQGYVWTDDPKVVGVNAMTLGMWAEVLNRWVGPATSVVALARRHPQQGVSPSREAGASPVPDSLAIAAELECGATASYHFSTQAAFGPGHSIEIYGSQGALIYQLFAEEIRGVSRASEKLAPIPIGPEEERMQTTDLEFIQAIQEGTPVSPEFEDGLRYMEFCEAVALSAKKGTRIPVRTAIESLDSWAGRPVPSSQL